LIVDFRCGFCFFLLNDSRACARRLPELLALLAAVSLRQREWDRANGDKCEQDERASKNLRFNGGVLFFHLVSSNAE